jgi:4'-phosphopantetheinyl transferase
MIANTPYEATESLMLSDWKQIDILPPPEAGAVQLWRIDLAGATGLHNHLTPHLSPSEQLHASRYRLEQAQVHFSVGRACLRTLLGNVSGLDPLSIAITTGAHGKPESPNLIGHNVAFNVAHSKDTILIALSRNGPVGVDVEYFDRPTDIMDVAKHNFTETETSSLEAIADPKTRHRTFYRYWTRKEAVLKADGRGLIASLASFDVSFESLHQHPIRMRESKDDQGKLFFVSDLTLGIEAAAAIALESPKYPIKQLIFPLNLLG